MAIMCDLVSFSNMPISHWIHPFSKVITPSQGHITAALGVYMLRVLLCILQHFLREHAPFRAHGSYNPFGEPQVSDFDSDSALYLKKLQLTSLGTSGPL